jgi:hypothetical protein
MKRRLDGKTAESRAGTGRMPEWLEHLIMPESKEMVKSDRNMTKGYRTQTRGGDMTAKCNLVS